MEKELKQQYSNCIKVVIFGPESTGKSTLSRQLATHYKTSFVPEYSRLYAEEKLKLQERLTQDDVLPIAIGQMKLENACAKQANRVLICDTNLLETKVYSEAYYSGFCPAELKKYAVENTYELYFLTYIDTLWEADDIRDKPTERSEMFNAFESALITYKKPYVVLKGSQEKRLKVAIKYIDNLLKPVL